MWENKPQNGPWASADVQGKAATVRTREDGRDSEDEGQGTSLASVGPSPRPIAD